MQVNDVRRTEATMPQKRRSPAQAICSSAKPMHRSFTKTLGKLMLKKVRLLSLIKTVKQQLTDNLSQDSKNHESEA